MKSDAQIILWRHADAEEMHSGGDLARELTALGHKQAKRAGQWLDQYLPKGTHILVSPAVRAQQTASALGRKFMTDDRVAPDAKTKGVLAAAQWPSVPCTLLVGHQPTLGKLASLLLTGSEKTWTIRKGAVWWIWLRPGHSQPSLRTVIDPALL